MNNVTYPEWVPESYIEAETLWEQAESLAAFRDVSCEFIIGDHNVGTLTHVSIQDLPLEGSEITRINAQFNGWEEGSYLLHLTDDRLQTASLHEVTEYDYEWLCQPDDIRIRGVHTVDDESREDMPWGQTDD